LVLIQVLTPGRGTDRDGAKPKCEAATTQACNINKLCIQMKAAGLMLTLADNFMALALQCLPPAAEVGDRRKPAKSGHRVSTKAGAVYSDSG
jgi:hypothetical protein